jgi:hypothetical protein
VDQAGVHDKNIPLQGFPGFPVDFYREVSFQYIKYLDLFMPVLGKPEGSAGAVHRQKGKRPVYQFFLMERHLFHGSKLSRFWFFLKFF